MGKSTIMIMITIMIISTVGMIMSTMMSMSTIMRLSTMSWPPRPKKLGILIHQACKAWCSDLSYLQGLVSLPSEHIRPGILHYQTWKAWYFNLPELQGQISWPIRPERYFILIYLIYLIFLPDLVSAPCHRGDFNLNGGPYKIFWTILSFVSKIFRNMLAFKILNEGFMVNHHSKSITKPKVELQLNLVLQQDILSASACYTTS